MAGLLARLEDSGRRAPERRAAELTGEGAEVLEILSGGSATHTGRRVSESDARSFSPWFGGIHFSASHIGSLPFKLYERREDGGRAEIRQHPASQIVRSTPNPRMTAQAFRETLHAHTLSRGTAYAEIVRNQRNQTAALWPLNPALTTLHKHGDGWFYRTRDRRDGREAVLPFGDVLNIPGVGGDGVEGWSVFRLAREAIARGMAQSEFVSRFYDGDGQLKTALRHPNQLSSDAKKRLRQSWQQANRGLDNSFRTAVLEEGIEVETIGVSPEDAEIISQQKMSIRDVARFLQLPPHILREMSSSTFSNIEEQSRAVVQNHLRPWASRWEQALNFKVLSDTERSRGLFFKFNLKGLLRGDTETRAGYFESRFSTLSITPNEIRELEDENPLDMEAADQPWGQLQDIPMSVASELSPAQRGMLQAVEKGDPELVEKVVEFRRSQNGGSSSAGSDTDRHEHRQDTPDLEGHAKERRRLVNAFMPIFLESFRRLTRAEVQEVRSELGRIFAPDGGGKDEFIEFIRGFMYDPDEGEIGGIIERTAHTELRSYAEAVAEASAGAVGEDEVPDMTVDRFMGGTDTSEGYLDTLTKQHASTSRNELRDAVESEDDQPRRAIEGVLERWLDPNDIRPRPERIADREVNRLGNAMAKAAYAAGGVVTFRWLAVGQSCPFCLALDGTVVGREENFVGAGESLAPADADEPLEPSGNIGHPPLHRGCWTPDHDILTTDGWVSIADVDRGDRLWTMNMDTHQMEVDRVQGAWSRRHEGRVGHVNTRTLDMKLTPDHKMAVVTGWRHKHGDDKSLERRDLEDTAHGDAIPRVPEWSGPNPDTIEVAGREWPSEDAMRFVGWYLAEGTICEHHADGLWRAGIRQHEDDSRGAIGDLCERLFDTVWRGKHTVYIPLRDGDPMIDWMQSIGPSGERYIPDRLLRFGPDTLRPMFDTLLAGDGSVRESQWNNDNPEKQGDLRPSLSFSTSSEQLASDMTELALKVGLRPTVRPLSDKPRTTEHWNGTYTAKKVQHAMSFGRNRWSTFKPDIVDWETYDGAVIGISMENNPVVLVRRNGKTCWVGNCDCLVVPGTG